MNSDNFTTENLKYSIPAKDFYDLINSLNDRLSKLELELEQIKEGAKYNYKRLEDLAITAFNSR